MREHSHRAEWNDTTEFGLRIELRMTKMPDVALDGGGGGAINSERVKAIFADVADDTPDGLKWKSKQFDPDDEHPYGNSTHAIGLNMPSDELHTNEAIEGLQNLAADGFTEGEIRDYVNEHFVSAEVTPTTVALEMAAKEAGVDPHIVTTKEQGTLDHLTDLLVEELVRDGE